MEERKQQPVIALLAGALSACGVGVIVQVLLANEVFGESFHYVFVATSITLYVGAVALWVWAHGNYVENKGINGWWGFLSLLGPLFGSLPLILMANSHEQSQEVMNELNKTRLTNLREKVKRRQTGPINLQEGREPVDGDEFILDLSDKKTCLACGIHIPAVSKYCFMCGTATEKKS